MQYEALKRYSAKELDIIVKALQDIRKEEARQMEQAKSGGGSMINF